MNLYHIAFILCAFFLGTSYSKAQESLIDSADRYIKENRLDSAMFFATQALQFHTELQQYDSIAISHSYLAWIYEAKDELDKMKNELSLLEAALLKMKSKTGNTAGFAYRQAGVLCLKLKDYKRSKPHLINSINAFRKDVEPHPRKLGLALADFAEVHLLEGQVDSARTYYETAAEIFVGTAYEGDGGHNSILGLLAGFYFEQEKWFDAVNVFRKSEKYTKDYDKNSIEALLQRRRAALNLAVGLSQCGNLREATHWFEEALTLSQKLYEEGRLPAKSMINFHLNQGALYNSFGAHEKALTEYKLAEAIALKEQFIEPDYSLNISGFSTLSRLVVNFVTTYQGLNDDQLAAKYFEFAEKVFKETDYEDLSAYTKVKANHARYISRKSFNPESVDIIQELLRLQRTSKLIDKEIMTICFDCLRAIYFVKKDHTSAIECIDSAMLYSNEIYHNSQEEHMGLLVNKASAQYELNQIEEAQKLIDTQLKAIGIPLVNPSQASFEKLVYHTAGLRALELKLKLLVSSNPSVTVFLEWLKVYDTYLQNQILNYESLVAFSEIKNHVLKTYEFVVQAIFGFYLQNKENLLTKEALFNYSEKAKNIQSRLLLNDLEMRSFAGVPEELIQEEWELKAKINYCASKLGSDTSGTFESQKYEHLRAYERFQKQTQEKYPEYFRLKFDYSVPDLKTVQASLEESQILLQYYLSDSLSFCFQLSKDSWLLQQLDIAPKKLNTQIDRLYSALKDVQSNAWLEPALALSQNLDLDGHSQKQFYIIPDGPLYRLSFELVIDPKNISPRNIAFLPSINFVTPRQDRTHKSNEMLSIFPGLNTASKDNLPFTRKVRDLLGEQYNAKVLNAEEAVESNVKLLLPQYDILHFSTHGVLDEQHPLSSYLELKKDEDNDGELRLSEIMNIPMKAWMTVLNACSTAEGVFRSGTGMTSLANAFFFAGSQNLLISHWDIDEQSSGDVLIQFYKTLDSESKNIPVALSKAKEAYLEVSTKELRHPYYWAGISAYGNIPASRSNNHLFLIIGAILFFVLSFWFFGSRLKN